MNKVFLYLYPIEEFSKTFFLGNNFYDENNIKRPFDVLNETIQKRYRDKGYQVVFALYPDKEIFGVVPQYSDKVIYTDITFKDASGYHENGDLKSDNEIKYPNEQFLISQLGNIDELIIGGYHAQDCVKRVGEVALNNGINALIDLDMTDLFFNLYRQDDYFKIDSYSSERFKSYMIEKSSRYGQEFAENLFNRNYQSSAYGFNNSNNHKKI